MGLGATALITNPKKEMPGPPFAAGSADNGLSVDSVTGRIVLGNDLGDAAAPARLLNDREIMVEDAGGVSRNVTLNSVLNDIITVLRGFSLEIFGGDNTTPSIGIGGTTGCNAEISIVTGVNGGSSFFAQTDAGGVSSLTLLTNTDQFDILTDGLGEIFFRVGGIVNAWSINTTTFRTQIGPTLQVTNTALLQVNGSLTRRLLVVGKGAVAYDVDRDLDSDIQFINSGAATFNLPNMAAGNNRAGFIFRICVKNIAGVTLQAFAGQVIRFGSLSTSSGGTLASTDVGAYCKLIWDNTNWVTETFNGAWNIT